MGLSHHPILRQGHSTKSMGDIITTKIDGVGNHVAKMRKHARRKNLALRIIGSSVNTANRMRQSKKDVGTLVLSPLRYVTYMRRIQRVLLIVQTTAHLPERRRTVRDLSIARLRNGIG